MAFLCQSYLQLPEVFYVKQSPCPVTAPATVLWNRELAASLGLDPDVALYSGNRVPAHLQPLAQAYAGHQFGHFTMLGDGRALLLGEAEDWEGNRWDVQLKGSGRTPFSRGGDGRAALEPMLREYLISEAMHALGIPSTRSLAVLSTGEPVYRETALPGAVLTRVAASHLRVGTFEFASAFGSDADLMALVYYALARHDPVREGAAGLLQGVMERQAALVAKWMAVGFVHGVMNTDNMAISGETIDYGPCAFIDRYDPETVFSSIDRQGRYAFGNQPQVAHWNLAVLAGALLPGFSDEAEARGLLDQFPQLFRRCWQREMNAKLGLSDLRPGDETLVKDLLALMQEQRLDYTLTFARLDPEKPLPGVESWHARWRDRLREETEVSARMLRHNPRVIPRNHVVEAALQAAGRGDMGLYHEVLDALQDPWNPARDFGPLAEPPPADAPHYRTFCGT